MATRTRPDRSRPEKQKRQLTAYLMKEDVGIDEAVRKDVKYRTHAIKQSIDFPARVYTKPPTTNNASWGALVNEGLRTPVDDLLNRHTAGLVIVEVKDRVLAYTFGYGRSLLNLDRIERRFGLTVVLNTNPDGLNSLDTAEFQEFALQTKRQSSRPAGIMDFGLDPTRDMVKAITGEPEDKETFGRRLHGYDSLVMTIPIEFADFGDLSETLLETFESDRYKEHPELRQIDYIRRVTDPELRRRLDDALLGALNNKEFTATYLAPPDTVEWERVDKVRYQGARGTSSDLTIEKYVKLLPDDTEFTIELLKRHRIELLSSANEQVIYGPWRVYDCIVFEHEDEKGNIFALVSGEWLQADGPFAAEIKAEVAKIRVAALDLPEIGKKEKEGEYNKRVEREVEGVLCLDQKRINLPEAKNLEACDLYGPAYKIRHVKVRKSSALLSHLWNQGLIGSELLLRSQDFRRQMRGYLRRDADLQATIPDDGEVEARKFTIQYALLGGKRDLPDSLPFFSKVSLVNVVRRLRSLLKFKVELLHVPREK